MLEAMHDIVRAGMVRYIWASAMYALQFQKALHVAEDNGWLRCGPALLLHSGPYWLLLVLFVYRS